jgi:23S rRNA (uracil1939-C5)-methyltransferase
VEGDEVETLELVPSSVVAGGDALARDADGRIVFVQGALPGERVRVAVTQRKRDFARATTTEVLDGVDGRVAPPCPEVRAGCGGCDYQWITPALQRRLKVDIVTDALRRLGRVEDPEVREGPALATDAYRTTVRCVVVDGRAGYRQRSSHDAIAVERCLVAHPLIDSLIEGGRFGGAREVTLRAGAATGERLALVAPRTAATTLPDDVVVVGEDELRRGRRAWYHEEVAGRRWRISARSFFQVRPDGAEALVDQVRAEVADLIDGDRDARTVVDAGAGVGLLAGTVGAELAGTGGRVLAIERGASAVADARTNLADLPVTMIQRTIEAWRPERASVVLADPSREGLGRKAVEVLAATGAERLVLVSCDPAALGRDTRLLAERGLRPVRSTLVDLFPQTSHVEVVTRFDRSPA